MSEEHLQFGTQALHAGYDREFVARASSIPIYQSAAFDMVSVERGDRLSSGEEQGFSYSRVANPTVDTLERRLAQLEGGISAVATASGMAAISFALLAAAEGGGHIVSAAELYGASVDAMETFFPQFGIETTFVDDINDLAAVEQAIQPNTRAIFAETVANPSTVVTDIASLAKLAHRHGIPLIVDNTVPTPYLCRPIELGADVVVHSTTKGITGHGNALGGIVIDSGNFDWSAGKHPQFTQEELVVSDEEHGVWHSFASAFGKEAYIRRVRIKYLRTFGAVPSPFNAYLQLIGLETLVQRVRQQVQSATRIAQYLQHHPHVRQLNYSGIGTTGQADLVRTMLPKGVGQVLSFTFDGTAEQMNRFINATTVFSYIPNIGDSKSLIVNPAKITHREVPRRLREVAGVSDNLIRLSIGLEDADDLIADLEQAFAVAFS